MSYRLEDPAALWLLLALIPLVFLTWRGRLRRGSLGWPYLILTTLGFTCCVIGLVRPQGGRYSTTQRAMKGDVYLAVDVSNSMRAEDLSPSRLEFAALFGQKVLSEIPGVRVALYPFAADGYLQMPVSLDHEAVSDLLRSISPSFTTNQGTDFATALTTLLTTINRKNAIEAAPARVLLFSDGETHDSRTDTVLSKFRSLQIPIDTVGVGTPQGGRIPMPSKSGFGVEPLRDSSGKVVLTKLVPDSLLRIAQATGGNYYQPKLMEAGAIAQRILQGMSFGKLQTTFKLEREYFPVLFLTGLTLLSATFLLGNWRFFIKSLLLTTALGAQAASAGNTSEAFEKYNKALRLVDEGKQQEAADLFHESASQTTNDELKKKALYNLGNALLRLQDPAQAVGAYQRAYDIALSNKQTEKTLNDSLSNNILVARKQQQEQEAEQKEQQQDGEGEGGKQKAALDPGKAKRFEGQTFNESQKKRLFEAVSNEEQQVLQRLQNRNSKPSKDPRAQQW
jgi:Ca-activated chloride channel homolog